METAGLFAIAQARGAQAASVLVISDSLAGLRWEAPSDPRPAERSIETAYAAVLEMLATHQLTDVAVEMVGIPDEFVEHGTPALLREKYGITGPAIARRAMDAGHSS